MEEKKEEERERKERKRRTTERMEMRVGWSLRKRKSCRERKGIGGEEEES